VVVTDPGFTITLVGVGPPIKKDNDPQDDRPAKGFVEALRDHWRGKTKKQVSPKGAKPSHRNGRGCV
jgi:hypothetical protein